MVKRGARVLRAPRTSVIVVEVERQADNSPVIRHTTYTDLHRLRKQTPACSHLSRIVSQTTLTSSITLGITSVTAAVTTHQQRSFTSMDLSMSYEQNEIYRNLVNIMQPYRPILTTTPNVSLMLTDMPTNFIMYRERAEAAGVGVIVSISGDQFQHNANECQGSIRQLFVDYYEPIPESFVPQWLDILESLFRVRSEIHHNTVAIHSYNNQAAILVAIALIENGCRVNVAINTVEINGSLNNLEREFIYNYRPNRDRPFGQYMRIE